MISLAILLASAALAGAAGGTFVYGRVRKKQGEEPKPEREPKERGPIALGDVIVLDEGRGGELWVARELALCEAGAPPWLVLFEADGPEAARAILAWDPNEPSSFAVLSPRDLKLATRLPSKIEVEVDGAPTCLTLIARRTSLAELDAAPSAEGASALAPAGELLVGTYRGGARGFAVVTKTASGAWLYAGHRVAMHEVSVLKVDRAT